MFSQVFVILFMGWVGIPGPRFLPGGMPGPRSLWKGAGVCLRVVGIARGGQVYQRAGGRYTRDVAIATTLDMGPGIPLLTPNGGHHNMYGWQVGSMYPKGESTLSKR